MIRGPIFFVLGHFFLDESNAETDTKDMMNEIVGKECMNLRKIFLDKHSWKCDVEDEKERKQPNTRRQ